MVIAIIAILAGIGIPLFTGAISGADRRAVQGDLKQAWSQAKSNSVGIPDMNTAGSFIQEVNGVSVDQDKTNINQLVIVKQFSGGWCEMTIPNNGQDPSFGRDC